MITAKERALLERYVQAFVLERSSAGEGFSIGAFYARFPQSLIIGAYKTNGQQGHNQSESEESNS